MQRSTDSPRQPRCSLKRYAVNNAFRVEDAIKLRRMRRARRRGDLERVEAYTGYGSPTQVRVLGRVQMVPEAVRRYGMRRFALFGLRRRRERALRGWRSFVRVTVPHTTVQVEVAGQTLQLEADRGGILDHTFNVSLTPGWHEVTFTTVDEQVTTAQVFIAPESQHVGIVSDVDDTVMVTALPRPLLAAWNTFVLDEHARQAVPGMNVLSQRLLERFGADTTPLFYLSTGSWNIAPMLSRFLARNLFPFGPMLLTDWGPTTKRLFRSGAEHKRASLRALAATYPHMRWVLVGDDGQHDEEIYGQFAVEFPERVLAVAIRQLSNTESVLAGSRAGGSARWRHRTKAPWVYGPNGAALAHGLAEHGILPADAQAAGLTDLSQSLAPTRIGRPTPLP